MLLDLKHTAFAVISHMSAAGLKEEEGAMQEEVGRGSFFMSTL